MSLEIEAFVALASNQLTTQVNFYRALLQIEPTTNSSHYADFCLTGLRLAIFEPSAEHASVFTAEDSGAMSLCLEVSDLTQAIAHLNRIGYPPTGEIIHASHGQEIYVYDPDGNRLILHQKPL